MRRLQTLHRRVSEWGVQACDANRNRGVDRSGRHSIEWANHLDIDPEFLYEKSVAADT